MGLTVKGSPMNPTQHTCATILLNVATTEQAGSAASEAIIFAAIFESSLGMDLGWDSSNPTYGGPLAGNRAYFAKAGSAGSSAVAAAQAFSFFKGGNGYQAGGALNVARSSSDPAYIASQVEAATPFNAQGYSLQYLSQGFPFEKAVAEAKAIVAAHGGHVTKGGVAGAGGSGTVKDGASQYAFRIGGTSNPDEDYWTGINRLAQEVNWYLFSNGECLYYMDGQEMIAQKPAMHIDRYRDQKRLVLPFRGNFDNCLALDTPIPTPDGWTTMGEIEVGDRVLGSDGRATRVLATSSVHLNHECFSVRFSDGTEIIADDGHRWETIARRRSSADDEEVSHQRYRGVRTTRQILDTLRTPDASRQLSHAIKMAAPLELPDRALTFDPYLFGYWLGDGHKQTPAVTVSEEDYPHLLGQLASAGYSHNSVKRTSNGFGGGAPYWRVSFSLLPEWRRGKCNEDNLTRRLRYMGVLRNKHIPRHHLRASYEQRLALLQGIMDSDGSVSKYCCLCIADKKLARDAIELIRSLGFRVKWTIKPARGSGKEQVCLNFATRPGINPFRLPRKARRYEERLAEKSFHKADRQTIVAIEPVPSRPVKCIQVDAPDHLYLAGEGMVPTHNTAFGYVSDHLRKFRVQRKTKLTTVTSPTSISLNVICGIDELRGGDVVVLSSFGLLDGRWIVGDVIRSVFAPYSQVTLVPPIAPLTEAAAAGTTGKSPTSTTKIPGAYPVTLTGTLRNHVVQAALAAVKREAQHSAYTYDEIRPMPSSLFGPAPVKTDCSGFATLCYKDAGAPDPNGLKYDGSGNTTTLVNNGTPVHTPSPADLLFYAGAAPLANGIGHVAVYVGNGNVASNGSQGDPRVMSMTAPGRILAMRSYL